MEEPMTMGSPQSPIRSQKTYMTEFLLGSGGGDTPKYAASSHHPSAAVSRGCGKPNQKNLLNLSQTNNNSPLFSSPNVSSRASFKSIAFQHNSPHFNSPRFSESDRNLRVDSPWVVNRAGQQSDKFRNGFSVCEQSKRTGPPIATYHSPRVGTEDSRLHRSFTNTSLLDQSQNSFSNDFSRNLIASRDSKIPSYLTSEQSFGELDSTGRPNTSSGDEIDLWVTIFGFPPAAAKHVLQDFALTSTICEQRLCNESNWMHLKFSNRIEVSKALAKSGKIIGKNMMIGVVPCIDSSVLLTESESWQRQKQLKLCNETSEPVLNSNSQVAINSPLCEKKSILNETAVPIESTNSNTQGGGLRPLTKPSMGTPTFIGDNLGLKNDENHSQSVLSKAVEYFFGN